MDLKLIAEKFGIFIVAGLIGAFVKRLRTNEKVSIRRFIANIFIAIFVSLAIGILCKEYFNFSENIVYVCCGVSGVFANELLNEIEAGIKGISTLIKEKFFK